MESVKRTQNQKPIISSNESPNHQKQLPKQVLSPENPQPNENYQDRFFASLLTQQSKDKSNGGKFNTDVIMNVDSKSNGNKQKFNEQKENKDNSSAPNFLQKAAQVFGNLVQEETLLATLPINQNRFDLILNFTNINDQMDEEPLAEEEVVQSPKTEAQNLNDSKRAESAFKRRKKSKNEIDGLSTEKEIEFGEKLIYKTSDDLKCECMGSLRMPILEGSLFVTNYKIVFKYKPMQFTNPEGLQQEFKFPPCLQEFLSMPYGFISRVEKVQQEKRGIKTNFVEVYTKDYRYLKLIFENSDSCSDIHYKIHQRAFPENQLHEIFALTYFLPEIMNQEELIQNGQDVFQDPELEFKRQGINFDQKYPKLRLFTNESYKVCTTYPRVHVVPQNINTPTLVSCSKFRTKNRFPSLTYYDKETLCSIWRSSQTMTGILTSRNQDDELMLSEIAKTNVKNPDNKLIIYDARSYLNALANRVIKGGYENTQDYYTSCEIVFCDIENIHSVRDAITKVYDMTKLVNTSSRALTIIDNTNWLQIISKILNATNNILDTIFVRNCNVLVHCTDGWDRTAQLCSLAQIMIDPYFRTIKGFQILIEKDWLSFGHMFARRLGHHDKNYKDDQRCPIFIQFLDCVFQLLRQFPKKFEYNSKMLLLLANEVYTCKYGTFLCNSERERRGYELFKNTFSIWSYINANLDLFMNAFYNSELASKPLRQIKQTNYFKLILWEELYFQYNPDKNTNNPYYWQKQKELLSPDDQKDQVMRDTKNWQSTFMKRVIEGSQSLFKMIDHNTLTSKVPASSIINLQNVNPHYFESKDPQKSLMESSFEIIRKSEVSRATQKHQKQSQIILHQDHFQQTETNDDSQNVSIIESNDDEEEETDNNDHKANDYFEDEEGYQRYNSNSDLNVSIKTSYIK